MREALFNAVGIWLWSVLGAISGLAMVMGLIAMFLYVVYPI